jgi:hypothetical protein
MFFPLYASSEVQGAGLFGLRYGDTKAAFSVGMNQPLIRRMDRLFWVLYMERLDVNGFYNYGGSWFEAAHTPRVFSHATGVSLDVLLDNKGISFRMGLGLGRLNQRGLQAYGTFGFDALW